VRKLLLVALLSLHLLSACGSEPTPAEAVQTIRLMTGIAGGGYYGLARALADAFADGSPTFTVDVREGAGSVSTIEAIQAGTVDVGFALADVAYMAFNGRLEQRPNVAFANLSGLSLLDLTPVHLLVAAQSSITRVEQLRGRSIAVGPPGSGTALTVALILRAFGMTSKDVRTITVPFHEGSQLLATRGVDAMFVTSAAPAEAVATAVAKGARLLPIEGDPVRALRREYPFFRLARIPNGTYAHHTTPVRTIGLDTIIVCRRDLDEAIAYELTRRFVAAVPQIQRSAAATLRLVDLDSVAATPIPLHPGAARYYRERELFQ
jgi:TRAP transporter TAXI family solute receptor